ncbi:penicillin-binding protein activator LpoB [Thalassotalea crassostreae]|uniref:penicillin-binding protein activator LpoB n=1 Tax=Thalassotalea crassostreae TaxID=1763536 RepID=UPI000839726E|nr:penicillin-binding protein activator LpoB [Thalassotalea crassostreae]
MKLNKLVGISLACAIALTGCSTTVERVDASTVADLSGAWNDTDSQLTAKTMVADALTRPWFSKHLKATGKSPTVIVGRINNLSHEHINTQTFISDIERELINSGEVEFVADSTARKEIREERGDQDLNATEATRNAMGQEIGADYMMQGNINTIIDVDGSDQVRFYQVDLELVSMKDNRKVWIGQQKIKKLVENSKMRK